MVDVGAAPIDRYVVLQHLSEGGMGAIYVGKKLGAGGFEMEVVLKQLLPEFTQQEEFIDLFLREAKLSATLDHANIVHTIDLVTAGGEYFIVMEYLPGGDLRTLLKRAKRRGRRFSPAAAIYITREVLSALAYAHVKRDFSGTPLKLIHRDVSPSNILISYAGECKLTDFGIAKAATHTSLFYKVKGKIGYMSPEQAKSETLDHRSDLYSLAVCLFEIITGERLFVHAGLTTSAEEIYSQPVPSLLKKIPKLPPELDAVMQKALAIDADRRYQTAGEFNEALTRCAHRHGLLMSAPELAAELLEACGPTEQWREEDDDDELVDVPPRAGTEVLSAVGDDDDDDDDDHDADDDDDGDLMPLSRIPAKMLERPKTKIEQLQGVELTSLINLIDLEQQGARPLDLDSGARRMDDSAPLEPPRPPMPGAAPNLGALAPSAMGPWGGPQGIPGTMAGVGGAPRGPGIPTPLPSPPMQPMGYPQYAPPQATQVPRTMQGVGAIQPSPKPATTRSGRQPVVAQPKANKKSRFRPLVVIVALLLAGAIVTSIIAFLPDGLPG